MLTMQKAELKLTAKQVYQNQTIEGTVTLLSTFPKGTSLVLECVGLVAQPSIISPSARTTTFKVTGSSLGDRSIKLVQDKKSGAPLAQRTLQVIVPQVARLDLDGGTTVRCGVTKQLKVTLNAAALRDLEVNVLIASPYGCFDVWRSPVITKKKLKIAKGAKTGTVNVAFAPNLKTTSRLSVPIHAAVAGYQAQASLSVTIAP